MKEEKQVVEEEEVEDAEVEGLIEIVASIDSSGGYKFEATDGVHPMFLVGLLQYSINTIIEGNKSSE